MVQSSFNHLRETSGVFYETLPAEILWVEFGALLASCSCPYPKTKISFLREVVVLAGLRKQHQLQQNGET